MDKSLSFSDYADHPPVHFPISASVLASSDTITVAIEKCELCNGSKRSFYCRPCVVKGDFVYSKYRSRQIKFNVDDVQYQKSTPESYLLKKLKWQGLLQENKLLAENSKTIAENQAKLEQKKCDLLFVKQRTELLKKAIRDAQVKLVNEKKTLEKLVEENSARKSRYRRQQEKQSRITQYIEKYKSHCSSSEVLLESSAENLSGIRRQHAQHLFEYLFPVEQIQPKSEPESCEESTIDLLAEARHTSYVKGRWVYAGHGSEMQYRIVHPTLPGHGDYSALIIWSQASKEESVGSELAVTQKNPAYNMGAALQYTAQLASVLSYLLDVNLPHRVQYSSFGEDLDEQHFQSLVYRLNDNVLHLCASQHVSADCLQPRHTLHNTLTLLHTPTLGRTGPFWFAEDLMQSFEETVPADMVDTDQGDEADLGDVEWEQVSGSLPEAEVPTPTPSFYSSTQVSSRPDSDESTGIAGGLMSSATAAMTSLWRGWSRPTSPR